VHSIRFDMLKLLIREEFIQVFLIAPRGGKRNSADTKTSRSNIIQFVFSSTTTREEKLKKVRSKKVRSHKKDNIDHFTDIVNEMYQKVPKFFSNECIRMTKQDIFCQAQTLLSK